MKSQNTSLATKFFCIYMRMFNVVFIVTWYVFLFVIGGMSGYVLRQHHLNQEQTACLVETINEAPALHEQELQTFHEKL